MQLLHYHYQFHFIHMLEIQISYSCYKHLTILHDIFLFLQ